jgi:hypothetical protein
MIICLVAQGCTLELFCNGLLLHACCKRNLTIRVDRNYLVVIAILLEADIISRIDHDIDEDKGMKQLFT